jgi:hypothetical protein
MVTSKLFVLVLKQWGYQYMISKIPKNTINRIERKFKALLRNKREWLVGTVYKRKSPSTYNYPTTFEPLSTI